MEFKVENVESVVNRQKREDMRTENLPEKYADKQGNEYGCKFYSQLLIISKVYRRFAWNDFQIQQNFAFKAQNTMSGPGYYSVTDPNAKTKTDGRKGVFSRTSRTVQNNSNPGPGAYKINDSDGIGQSNKDSFCMPREERQSAFPSKPDYDMSAFYKRKFCNKKQYLTGFSFEKTEKFANLDEKDKKLFPGPAQYNVTKAEERATTHLLGPAYTVPLEGCMNLDTISRYYK